jgi:hypothetical protein
MRLGNLLLLALLSPGLLASAAATEPDAVLGASCNLAVLGVTDKRDFLRFDHELRAALATQDVAALSLLINFPLRVNYAEGSSIALDNPAALQQRFAEIFSPALRKIVSDQKVDDFFCKEDGGLMYGNGELWVQVLGSGARQRFRVAVLNVSAAAAKPATQVQLACETAKYRIVIDTNAETTSRYRVWNKPRSAQDKPDLELTGTQDYEGTGSCAHRIWHFTNADTVYEVSEPGCAESPQGATAQLQVLLKAKSQLETWCY